MRLAEIASTARRGPAGAMRAGVRAVGVIAAAAVVWYGILGLRGTHTATATIAIGGAAITIAVGLAALAAPAAGARDPGAFAAWGLRARVVVTATLVNRTVAPIGLLLVVAGSAVVTVWHAQGVPIALGAIGALLGLAVCVAVAALCDAAGRALRPATVVGRTAAGVAAVVVGVGVPAVVGFRAAAGHDGALDARVAHVLAASPIGAAWALPAGWAAGDPHVWVVGAVAVAAVAAGLAGAAIVIVTGTTRRRAPVRARPRRGWFAITRATPAGVIAARSLTYWLHDARYVSGLCVVPVVAALSVVPLLVVGVSPAVALLVPAPVAALFFGWLPHNDTAYDSTALWVHVAGGVRGRADRAGRIVPPLVVGIPVVAVAVVVGTVAHGAPAAAPLAGACVGLLLTGLGVSSIVSAVLPYPVTQPGDGLFRQPQRSGVSAAVAQTVALGVTVLVCGPALWVAWVAVAGDEPWGVPALGVGLATGVVVAVAGVLIGGLLFDRRGTALLEHSESV